MVKKFENHCPSAAKSLAMPLSRTVMGGRYVTNERPDGVQMDGEMKFI